MPQLPVKDSHVIEVSSLSSPCASPSVPLIQKSFESTSWLHVGEAATTGLPGMPAIDNVRAIALCDDEMVITFANLFFFEFARSQGANDRELSNECKSFISKSEMKDAFNRIDDAEQIRFIRKVLDYYANHGAEITKDIDTIFDRTIKKLELFSLSSATDMIIYTSCLSMLILSIRIKSVDFKKGVEFAPITKATVDFVKALPSVFRLLISDGSDNENN